MKKPFPRLRGLVALSFVTLVLASYAHAAFADTPTIKEVDVYGNGSGLPANTSAVSATVNGTPASVTFAGSFGLNKFVVNGNPGDVTVVYTIQIVDSNGLVPSSTQTVSLTTNVNTGAVSASGTDSANGYNGTIALDVDGTIVNGQGNGGSFSISGMGQIDNNIIKSCVVLPSGMRVCADAFAMSEEKANSPASADAAAASASPPPVAKAMKMMGGAPPPPSASAMADSSAFSGDHKTHRDEIAKKNYAAAIRGIGEQLSDMMVYQLPIIGIMMDAKHQLETQRLFGEAAAQAHRDYLPDEEVCAFGTLARGTAPAKFKLDDNASVINTILQKRETLNINTISAWGPGSDFVSRIAQYKKKYCDPNDDDGEIKASGICQTTSTMTSVNKDVDYRRTISSGLTLDLDFTDTTVTQDEEDVLALAKNLYAHTIVTAIPEQAVTPYSANYRELQDSRMLSAVRSVARDSYANIAASKAKGSGLNATQVSQVIHNLGVPAADVTALIGTNPSYFAQMEIFTQKIFQDPNFYASLYMNPANVSRMKVVLQAVRLMADRDRFEEGLRREMLISMLLEMRLRQAQQVDSNNAVKATGGTGIQ